MDIKAKTDAKIESLKRQLAKLTSFRDSLEDPEVYELLDDEEGEGDVSAPQPRKPAVKRKSSYATKTAAPTGFSKVKEFFDQRNNAPATAREIRLAAGFNSGFISNLIYVKRKDRFEKIEGHEDEPTKWRLKKDFTSK